MTEAQKEKSWNGWIFLFSLVLMACAWLADAGVDAFFEDADFLQQVFLPDSHELAIRAVFLASQVVFLLFISCLLARRRRLKNDLSAALLQAETERSKSEAILDALGDAISIQDPNLKVLYQNAAHRRLMGDHRGEFCYWAYQNREEACPECHLLRSFVDGRTHVRESSAVSRKGGIDVEIISTPLPDSCGRIIAGIESVRDITERRRLETQLREQLAAMEGSIDGIAILDRDGVYTYLNPSHARIYGYNSPEQLIGKTWRSLYDAAELERFDRAIVPEFLEQGRWWGETVGLRQNGSCFPQEISLTATANGGVVCVVRDITQRKENEESIQKMNCDLQRRTAELEIANRELEAFSGSLSHDIRSYLTRISIAAQALESFEGGRLRDNSAHCLHTIIDACEDMDGLIDSMLVLARVNQQELHRARVDLTALAQEVAGELACAEPHRQFRFEIAEELTVEGSPDLLRIVLENLLGNACKYSRDREISEIGLTTENLDGRMVFSVRDNGTGFDMAERENLFRPFQRLGSASDFPGLGIGLTTVQRIIHRHNGEIWAEASPDQGAAFHFTLPEPRNMKQPCPKT